MSASNLPQFHRPNWPRLHHTHHPFARGQFGRPQFQPPSFRTMAMMQGPHTTPSNQGSATPIFNHNEPSFFEESFQYDHTPVGGDLSAYQPDSQWMNLHNFRPADTVDSGFNTSFNTSLNTSFNSSFGSLSASTPFDIDDAVPRKIESSPSLPALSYKVDTSKYENVDYEDYITRSTDLEGSSPSSIETESTGPPTPSSLGIGGAPSRSFFDDPFFGHRDSFVAKVESAPLQNRPDAMLHCNTSLAVPSGPVPLSIIYNDHHMTSNLNSFALHPHVHGGLVNSSTPYQGFVAPPSVGADSFDMSMSSTSSVPELDRPFLDSTSEEDTESESESMPELEANDRAVSEANHRRDRDRYLLKMREKGLSYKEIKRRGRFTEAESTLRGRVRVMTKHKSERVRKPVWTKDDVSHWSFPMS